LALRVTYWLPAAGTNQRLMYLYEGDARAFAAFIRIRAIWGLRWQNSTPYRVVFEGRSIDGWQLTTQRGEVWTLFEADGTLIAAQTNDAVQSAVLASLQRLRL